MYFQNSISSLSLPTFALVIGVSSLFPAKTRTISELSGDELMFTYIRLLLPNKVRTLVWVISPRGFPKDGKHHSIRNVCNQSYLKSLSLESFTMKWLHKIWPLEKVWIQITEIGILNMNIWNIQSWCSIEYGFMENEGSLWALNNLEILTASKVLRRQSASTKLYLVRCLTRGIDCYSRVVCEAVF